MFVYQLQVTTPMEAQMKRNNRVFSILEGSSAYMFTIGHSKDHIKEPDYTKCPDVLLSHHIYQSYIMDPMITYMEHQQKLDDTIQIIHDGMIDIPKINEKLVIWTNPGPVSACYINIKENEQPVFLVKYKPMSACKIRSCRIQSNHHIMQVNAKLIHGQPIQSLQKARKTSQNLQKINLCHNPRPNHNRRMLR